MIITPKSKTLAQLVFCVLLFCPTSLIGQEIATIKFDGLVRTDVTYLTNIIISEVGEPFDEATLDADVQRLKNLASIGVARFDIERVQDQVHITFTVEEVRTLLPVLNAGGIRDNLWLQLGLVDINWMGKGHQFSAIYQNSDRRHSGNIFYKQPRVNNSNWGYSASLNTWASQEPLFFDGGDVLYDYNFNGITLSGIRHFGYFQNIELGGTYFVEKYNKVRNDNEVDAPQSLTQPKWLGKLVYTNDRLNYDYFYLSGFKLENNAQSVFNTLDNLWFLSNQFTLTHFKRLGRKGNFAQRIKLAIASNHDSPFAPFVADSHVNIRGIGNRIDRGTAQVIVNTEYRHTVSHNKKWGVQGVVFADAGTWRNPGGSLSQLFDVNQVRLFVGGGVRLIYHKLYGASLRIDYGVDMLNKSQRGFVIGLGQYF